jgi:D-alanyl-D-alanine carboxypeptidase
VTRLFAVVATGVIAALGTSAGTGARVSLVTASGAHSQIPVLTRGRDAALRKLLAAAARSVHAPGGVLLVKTPASTWRRSVGAAQLPRSYARPEVGPRVPMPPGGRFRIASLTKTFTATVVLQLVAGGALSLDDTVERWLPGRLPDGAGTRITVRDLLQHRSGLHDTPLSFAGAFTVAGPPGTFYYANANYALLGEIVAAATHSTYEEELDKRVLGPLGLSRTEVARAPATPAGLVHGYSPKPVTPGGLRIDETAWTDFAPVPAGSIVSDARDIARFASALFAGQLVPPRQVALMQVPVSLDGFASAGYTGYGLGLMRFPTRCGDAWGHRGRTLGYTAYMLSTTDARRIVVFLLNTGHLEDDAIVRLDPFVERALCM